MNRPTLRYVDLLRSTADPLEALARRLSVELIGSGSWRASRCDDLMTDRCRCMVSAQKPGTSRFGQELYIASAQTPDLAQYLALFSPQDFAFKLAFLLRSNAREAANWDMSADPHQRRLRDKCFTAVVEIAEQLHGGLHE